MNCECNCPCHAKRPEPRASVLEERIYTVVTNQISINEVWRRRISKDLAKIAVETIMQEIGGVCSIDCYPDVKRTLEKLVSE